MYVIVVTPLIRGTKLESLSYFSSQTYAVGSFLEVPVRGKLKRAIVTEVSPAATNKTSLKSADFSLRKLPAQPSAVTLPKTLLQTAEVLTGIYPVSVGAIVYQLLPPDIRNGNCPYPDYVEPINSADSIPTVLTATNVDRWRIYKNIIRSAFAQRATVMLVVPTTAYISELVQILGAGIEERVVYLSSLQTKSKREKILRDFSDTTYTKLIITTPSYAYLVRSDCRFVIIDQVGSSHYVTRKRPYLDHRIGLQKFAAALGAECIMGDLVPPTELEFERRADNYQTYNEAVKRVALPASLKIITQSNQSKSEKSFQLFSEELKQAINQTINNNGRVFLYAARRGLAPLVRCIDCGHIFRCPDSGAPYSLMRTYNQSGQEERWFVSSTSGKRVPAADVCPCCGSWRLRECGIGIQQVAEEWPTHFTQLPLTVIDNTTATTSKAVMAQCKDFFAQPAGVLLGTQMVLPYLSQGVSLSAVLSLDAARSLPSWRADETLFRLFMHLRECSSEEVLVQTRENVESDKLLQYAQNGALEKFYNDELDLRQLVNYPPYCTFILLTWVGTTEVCREVEDVIKKTIQLDTVQYYNHPHSTRSKVQRHGLIRVPVGSEAREEGEVAGGYAASHPTLFARLRSLPPYIKVEINPGRIV